MTSRPCFTRGKNLISATVWNFGENAPVRQVTDRIGFLLDEDPSNQIDIRSDATWSVAIEKGLSTLATPTELRSHYYVASPAEKLDGNVFDWTSDDPDATTREADWKKAAIIGRASARGTMFAQTNWQLVPDALPLMERTQEDPGRVVRATGIVSFAGFPKTSVTIAAHQEVTILMDAGHLTTAYPPPARTGNQS